tara:strand:- start:1375 stop:1557 length:183 start_codon:yes stop_codon:yes gene_type:complete
MKNLIIIFLISVIVVGSIKFVEPVNKWARGNLPEEVLKILGEKPKGLIEKVGDLIISETK